MKDVKEEELDMEMEELDMSVNNFKFISIISFYLFIYFIFNNFYNNHYYLEMDYSVLSNFYNFKESLNMIEGNQIDGDIYLIDYLYFYLFQNIEQYKHLFSIESWKLTLIIVNTISISLLFISINFFITTITREFNKEKVLKYIVLSFSLFVSLLIKYLFFETVYFSNELLNLILIVSILSFSLKIKTNEYLEIDHYVFVLFLLFLFILNFL